MFATLTIFSQEEKTEIIEIASDTIVYNKNTDFVAKRTFKDNLKEKYTDKEFTYTESVEEKKTSPNDSALLLAFMAFMTNVFPYLLGGIIIFIILKTFLGTEVGFWNFKKNKKITSEKLVFEDEDIHEVDLEALLKDAIAKQEYRLAIRYYYLSVLKALSTKKLIDYHKDKTNSEYLFEIENTETRKQFSYLSYVYSYVWYGEFPVDASKFHAVEHKYKSFLKSNI
ncbi:DUF4129 domain-containing protein [Polaribacter pectinis]|uniref:DUF4129 domain-containing protein n=1 Tax=Polaribacter pectinis TaxID=2738844 RepID=A0A7G9LCP0_9FLAO|nr:DUF4129 domain-containing protein [Polaribacter pectinis]QNM86389.1 DUF4129 domain-containing protein [Polaribacter pectinis]